MAESGDRKPASERTMYQNLWKLGRELGVSPAELLDPSQKLRKELQEKGIKGFRRGGVVKTTGLAKVHKGERVLTTKQSKTYAKAVPNSSRSRRNKK